ncbi:MAG: hypothetical protein JEZ07_15895 [Phycisphaerae bacterium]|nr:hypothetical protein [Phycisphaerae bacterium]
MALHHNILCQYQSFQDGFKNFQDSFIDSNSLIILLSLFSLITVICIAIIVWQKIIKSQKKHYQHFNSAEKLFEDILAQLELADEDKKLLRQMTHQSRLKQPTVALLSPKLLENSCELWIKEKGSTTVTNEKLEQMSIISDKIFAAY